MPLPTLTEGDQLAVVLEPLGLTPIGRPAPIGDEFGFASSRVRVTVVELGGDEHSVVVKVWEVADQGAAEVGFYESWAPRLPTRLPAYRGGYSTDQMAVIVLEDLGPVRQGDAEFPFEPPDLYSVARSLGLNHSSTAGLPSNLTLVGRPRSAEWHESRRASYLERFGLPDRDAVRAIVRHSQVAERVGADLLAMSVPGLVHGDLHADNIVFLPDDTPVILDWSRPGWGSAAHDLASLLVDGAEPVDYPAGIEGFRSVADLSDDEIHGAFLRRLVTGTLGAAGWIPQTDRQRRLVAAGAARVEAAATWLAARAPSVVEGLAV